MTQAERLLIYVAGFLAGLAAGLIFGQGGGGGWGRWPESPSPIIPDYVPDEMVRESLR